MGGRAAQRRLRKGEGGGRLLPGRIPCEFEGQASRLNEYGADGVRPAE